MITQITQNGDKVTWPVKVTSDKTINDLRVEFDIPDGLKLVGPYIDDNTPVINPDRGAYNPDDDKWFVGTIEKDELIVQNFTFEVEDITKINLQGDGRFTVKATAVTDTVETTTTDNEGVLVLQTSPTCADLKLRIGTGEETESANISIQ